MMLSLYLSKWRKKTVKVLFLSLSVNTGRGHVLSAKTRMQWLQLRHHGFLRQFLIVIIMATVNVINSVKQKMIGQNLINEYLILKNAYSM